MASVESQPEQTARETSKKRDIIWVAASFGICGGFATYLFLPYVFPSLRGAGQAVEAIVGLLAGVGFAVLGGLLGTKSR